MRSEGRGMRYSTIIEKVKVVRLSIPSVDQR